MQNSLPSTFGRYPVVAAIHGGHMGRVYLAQDPRIDRLVVIKTLGDEQGQRAKDRFLREARAAGRMTHPNVVSIFDVGEQDGSPFIVMEFVDGRTLESIISERSPMTLQVRLELIDQLCAGLSYAHRMGVLHRDIKPSNLMVTPQGTLRILDFGLARLDSTDGTTGIVGTLNYISPEQWEGGSVDGRADMFSAGAVFYELLAFERAFPGRTPPEVLRAMLVDGPQPLDALGPDAPPAITAIVNRMLARRPEDRYAQFDDVRADLAQARRGLGP